MRDDKLDRLLKEIYSQDIVPSAQLLQKTKMKVMQNRTAEHLIALVVTFNLAVLLAFIYFIVNAPFGLLLKGMLYMTFSSIFNCIALAVYFYREQVGSFFQTLKNNL